MSRLRLHTALHIAVSLAAMVWLSAGVPAWADNAAADAPAFWETVTRLTQTGDRGAGGNGAREAAGYIRERFEGIAPDNTGALSFYTTVREYETALLSVDASGAKAQLLPLALNAVTPDATPPEGVEGPVIYVGRGDLSDFNGKAVEGAIILMDLDSGVNWLNAANLGAKALVYLYEGPFHRALLADKFELTPICFPRLAISRQHAEGLFGNIENAPEGMVAASARLSVRSRWRRVKAQNIYCLIEGSDPEQKGELLIVEAFYDSAPLSPGHSPGADEALGAAALLELGERLKQSPPGRSVLLVATAGHAQALSGMREMVWSFAAGTRQQREIQRDLKKAEAEAKRSREALKKHIAGEALDAEGEAAFLDAVSDRLKTEVDEISRRLMRLRLQEEEAGLKDRIASLAGRRMLLKRIGWRRSLSNLSLEESALLEELAPRAVRNHTAALEDVRRQLSAFKDVRKFRRLVRSHDLQAVVSLHLSSHGDGVGAFNQGFLYALKPEVDRVSGFSALNDAFMRAAEATGREMGGEGMFQDTLRPSRLRTWESYFPDRPALGGEVACMAGTLGVTLATVHDARPLWGTPFDVADNIDKAYAARQNELVCGTLLRLADESPLTTGIFPRNGFSTLTGRANSLRHGELFPDQAAVGAVLLAFQGPARYHAITDHRGVFYLKGVSDRKHVYDKVILEGYRFDPDTGEAVLAIDKPETGKDAYRVKMRRRNMETDLIMFACRQTTIFNLLEPRNFRHMTRIQLIDGRRESPPLRYWWSRIDTRKSVIASVFLEPGTPLKMTLSDSVLSRKLILTHATEQEPSGEGYRVEDWPFILRTEFMAATDIWRLLGPRIRNLESRGIFNQRIRDLTREGTAALREAETALKERAYDRFQEASARSWALSLRVYDSVEKTQKDVLFGVLFYIALFVPFAFCAERLLFGYADIHKRIVAFIGLLLLLILVIYMVHPAFRLAYSPMVVILAFFIMGLSLLVTLIIFFRFEAEMVRLQRRAQHVRGQEISRWKAFTAAFFLGVSNLRRRRLRTALTCSTLIILTFTIMSFTTVKSIRRHARVLFKDTAPYSGFLLTNPNWRDIPETALKTLENAFSKEGVIAPRGWIEDPDPTRSLLVPVRSKGKSFDARAVVGLSHREPRVSGMGDILVGGRWFRAGERRAVLLPRRMAEDLGIDPRAPEGSWVEIWGVLYDVAGVFSAEKLGENLDLNGEPVTAVTFPAEVSTEMTEVEMDALESGEDVQVLQSRYQHVAADLTVILPFEAVLSFGGRFKALAVHPGPETDVAEAARRLADRFGLSIFAGEPGGTYLYHAGDALRYSGVPNILIPILISVLIVLNTMISSVVERKREIGIYTSVGLAPSHVSFLFVAEALAFAVLSVVLGYILAQSTARIFAQTPLWAGITVNYSSISGVAAMVMVILVVLVSVLYPSRVAGRIAIPDVNRAFVMPKPKDDAFVILLPFLLKYREFKSIGGFLVNYFLEHRDVSHGLFSTGETDVAYVCPIRPEAIEAGETCPDRCLQFHSMVWLAPFDFGIMQRTDFTFCPAPRNPGFLEIRIHIRRLSGEATSWSRANKPFVHQIRKQLLLWRSLDAEAHRRFEEVLPEPEPGMRTVAGPEPAQPLPEAGV